MKKTKILATITIAVMLLSVLVATGNVFAETGTTAQTVTFSDSTENKLTITRYVKDTAENVTNTFTYTITPDNDSNPATVNNCPTSATVVFNDVTPNSNIATATGVLNLAGATFTKLGDYKFKVEETGSTNSTKYPLDETDYYIYVSVRNELDPTTNQPTGNFIATLAEQAKINDDGDKTDLVYESNVPLQEITISKTVTGNMADINEYFEFTLNITNGIEGATYSVSGAHSVDGTSPATEPTTLVPGVNTIYLKHGQTITIGNLPEGTKYTITEKNATDYETFIDGSTTNSKVSSEKTVTSANTDDNTAFVNNKIETTLTGIFLNVAPFIALIALAIAGIVIIKKTSNKED